MKHLHPQEAIQDLLQNEWITYRCLIKTNRKHPSEKTIHELRIHIQKLLVAIELAASVLGKSPPTPLVHQLKKTKKRLNSLRDLHIELRWVNLTNDSKLKSFKAHLKKHELKISNQAKKHLCGVSLAKQKQFIKSTKESLGKPKNRLSFTKVKSRIETQINRAIAQVKSAQHVHDGERPKQLHRLRIHSKHLRYLGEAQKQVLGHTHVNLLRVKKIQSALGKTQDHVVLLKDINHYLKHHHQDQWVQLFKNQVDEQKKIIGTTSTQLVEKTEWHH